MSRYYDVIIKNDKEETNEIHELLHGVLLDSITTHRGTQVDMVLCPTWGISCFMDDVIQSCEMDEDIYHHMLVFPSMHTARNPKRVMIIGGGEGATAREVLKWQCVTHVDMYDWDKDVVSLFQNKYPQWGKGAWNDKRLHLHFDNIFDIVSQAPDEKYDVIIIDLFDPDEENRLQWAYLFQHISLWAAPKSTIVMYAGMIEKNNLVHPYEMLSRMILEQLANKDISSYIVPVKSFTGDAVFLMLHDAIINNCGIAYKPISIL